MYAKVRQHLAPENPFQVPDENAITQAGDWRESVVWRDLAVKSEFNASKLARLCGVSIRTLQRHFALNSGATISVWLRTIRMQEAYLRLMAGSRVKEVAYDLRFKQLSHFSREFKKIHGIAPSLLNPHHLPL